MKIKIILNVLLHYAKYRKIVGEFVKIIDGKYKNEIGYVYYFEFENFKFPYIIHFPKTGEEFCYNINEFKILKGENNEN